ncbi:MAG: hypothetical protein Kow009_13820 [Spirochaetales bacterium]
MQAIGKRFDNLLLKYSCDRAMVRELLNILLRDMPRAMKELEEGVVESNVTKTRKAAHSLANISGTVEEFEILDLSRKVEAACVSQNLKEVESYLPPYGRGFLNSVWMPASIYRYPEQFP